MENDRMLTVSHAALERVAWRLAAVLGLPLPARVDLPPEGLDPARFNRRRVLVRGEPVWESEWRVEGYKLTFHERWLADIERFGRVPEPS